MKVAYLHLYVMSLSVVVSITAGFHWLIRRLRPRSGPFPSSLKVSYVPNPPFKCFLLSSRYEPFRRTQLRTFQGFRIPGCVAFSSIVTKRVPNHSVQSLFPNLGSAFFPFLPKVSPEDVDYKGRTLFRGLVKEMGQSRICVSNVRSRHRVTAG